MPRVLPVMRPIHLIMPLFSLITPRSHLEMRVFNGQDGRNYRVHAPHYPVDAQYYPLDARFYREDERRYRVDMGNFMRVIAQCL